MQVSSDLATTKTAAVSHAPDPPVTLRTLTLCLAFMHYCTPVPPQRGGDWLRPTDTARLAGWLGLPFVGGRRAAHNLPLAAHLILLHAAGLLTATAAGLRPSPRLSAWLDQSRQKQLAELRVAGEEARWAAAAEQLGLGEAVPLPYQAYFLQSLERRQAPPGDSNIAAEWLSADSDKWRLRLLPQATPRMVFDLLGVGEFKPPDLICCHALTLGTRRARDLGFHRVRRLLQIATQQSMQAEQQEQLRTWLAAGTAYRLVGPVLVTSRAEYLAELYTARGLRPYLLEQLGPRCVLIDRAGLPALQRRLAKRGFPLDAGSAAGEPVAPLDARTVWLGLRVLSGLQRYAPMAFPPPYETQALLEDALGKEETAELEAIAQTLLDALGEAIEGRDAWWPATEPVDPGLVDTLHKAIAAEQCVSLAYQAPGSREPRYHTIEPLRLDTRDQLVYLHAYSYRTESNLTFRLDRVTACGPPGQTTLSSALND